MTNNLTFFPLREFAVFSQETSGARRDWTCCRHLPTWVGHLPSYQITKGVDIVRYLEIFYIVFVHPDKSKSIVSRAKIGSMCLASSRSYH